ncbi:MAG TPA: nucleotidyl transferase AbiEii/AbiGii toxin family protein [Planctomycetota bacterium]|nr:nucleotidyl transferase AbiEii/AbiGii toxin family protein [Planctomycetota bacterium]
MRDRLSLLQRELLEGFFESASEFFLTGGAALAGFYLGHRTTEDLDLFVHEASLDEGVSALRSVADRLGASLEGLRTSPSFRRFLVRRGGEGVVVDLVHDPVPSCAPQRWFGRIRVDAPEEIFANKLCTLLSRAEIRDLVDVRALEAAGYDLQEALAIATRKDAGLTPGQLAWVLSEVELGEDANVPGGCTVEELREFLAGFLARLERLALPE